MPYDPGLFRVFDSPCNKDLLLKEWITCQRNPVVISGLVVGAQRSVRTLDT